jgi:hypothetical protein
MLPFGVTIPATVSQGSEIPEVLMNNPVLPKYWFGKEYIQLSSYDFLKPHCLSVSY